MTDSILDHPDLDALSELEKREAALALENPEERQRLILRTCLALRAEQKGARVHCHEKCAPGFDAQLGTLRKRVRVLEHWRWLILGGLAALATVWELIRAGLRAD